MQSLFIRLCFLTAVAFVAGLFGAGVSGAQEIKGPIKIIVPYPAGGGSDVVARFVAEKLKASLGQTVIVENKTGAGGRIGTEYAKTQPADGASMLVVNPALFVVAPLVFSKLGYDPDADFAPVSLVTTYQFCVSVPPASPIKNVKGLVEWIKQNPNQANYGSPAAGSLPHFFGLMIAKAAGVKMVHSSYNGSGPLVTALIGNQIPMGVDALDAQSAYHPDKLRILATAGGERKRPDIPTFKEEGFPDIQGEGWNAVVVPAKTPRPIIDKLSAAISKAVMSPDVVEKIRGLGNEAAASTPEELSALIRKDRERWAPIIKDSGFKAE